MSAPLERGVRVQVYLRQGRPVVRAVPATAEHPTSAQAASRAAFAVAAKGQGSSPLRRWQSWSEARWLR